MLERFEWHADGRRTADLFQALAQHNFGASRAWDVSICNRSSNCQIGQPPEAEFSQQKKNLISQGMWLPHSTCTHTRVYRIVHTHIYIWSYIHIRSAHMNKDPQMPNRLRWGMLAMIGECIPFSALSVWYIYIYICTELWFAIPKNDLTIVRGAKVNPTKCRTMSHCQSTSKVCSRTVWSFTDRHWLQNKHHLTPGLCHAMPHACIDTQKGVVVLVMLSESCLSGQMPSFLSCLNALE